MAEASVLQEFLAVIGFKVDEASQRRFNDALGSMTKAIEELSLGLASAAAGVATAISGLADSATKLQYLAINLHDSAKNVDAFRFAMSELGLTTQETDGILNNVFTNIKNNPGARQWLESFAPGKGTIEQLKAFAEAYRTATGESQRVLGQRAVGALGLNEDFLSAIRRAAPGEIDKYFQEAFQKNSAFGLDPDKAGKAAIAYQKAWTDLADTLDRIYRKIGQDYYDTMTAVFNKVNELLKSHGDDIEKILGEAIKYLIEVTNNLITAITSLVEWWDKLTPAQKQATETLVALGAAILTPYGKFVLLVEILKELPWDTIKSGFTWLVDKLAELDKATNGVITPLRILEGLFAATIALRVASFFMGISGAARLAASGVALLIGPLTTLTTGLAARFAALLVSLPALGAFVAAATISQNREHIASQSQEDAILGGTNAQRNPGNVIPGDHLSETDERRKAFFDWLKGVGNAVKESIFGSPAKADELPDSLKKLNDNLDLLNQHFMDSLIDSAGLGSDAGQDTSGGRFGGGSGGSIGNGGRPVKLNWKDPKTVQMMQYLMKNGGLSMVQAAAILGNFAQESQLDPNAENASGHYGEAQWDKKRQQDFRLVEGRDIHGSTWQQQLDFAIWELNNTEKKAGDQLKRETDLAQGTANFNKLFERSGVDPSPRIANAQNAFTLTAPLLSGSPNSYNYDNSSADKAVTVNQSNNTTIHGSGDPQATAASLEAVQNYNNQQLLRQLTSPFQ